MAGLGLKLIKLVENGSDWRLCSWAFTSFSRYARDCDFVLKKSDGWNIDRI
jgi:hypothetical protein